MAVNKTGIEVEGGGEEGKRDGFPPFFPSSP